MIFSHPPFFFLLLLLAAVFSDTPKKCLKAQIQGIPSKIYIVLNEKQENYDIRILHNSYKPTLLQEDECVGETCPVEESLAEDPNRDIRCCHHLFIASKTNTYTSTIRRPSAPFCISHHMQLMAINFISLIKSGPNNYSLLLSAPWLRSMDVTPMTEVTGEEYNNACVFTCSKYQETSYIPTQMNFKNKNTRRMMLENPFP